jgi:phosphatidylethanolamine-binding protein (PEBP) family uncharacterized protein
LVHSFSLPRSLFNRFFSYFIADYQGPAPPSGTGPHQYIFLLYKSAQGDHSQSSGSIAVSDSGKRKQFHLKKFESDHQLQLVATTSYTVIG